MMNRPDWLALLLVFLAGCAARAGENPAPPSPSPGVRSLVAATAPADPRAALTLDRIEPRPVLPASLPTTQPDTPPSLQALLLFAKARVEELDDHRGAAARLLEQVAAMDPQSFQVHRELGNVYAALGDPRTSDEWEKAASIDPDHLDLQIALGREAMGRGRLGPATRHLRLALQTTGYREDDSAAGEAEFLLARALQSQGYDTAALQMYERVLNRLAKGGMRVRRNPQLAVLLAHPDVLGIHVAGLYEKTGELAAAIGLLRAIADREPQNLSVRARIVRDTAAAGHRAEAVREAVGLVSRFHADPQSLEALSDAAGSDAAGVLQRLQQANPHDPDLLYALTDVYLANHRPAEAGRLLDDASRQWPDDLRLIRRRTELLQDRGDFTGAARVLVAALARQPDHDPELGPLWKALALPTAKGRLRLSDVRALVVPPGERPALDLLLARAARAAHYVGLARDTLRKAVDARPIFAPAWRQMQADAASDPSLSRAQSRDAQAALARDAGQAGRWGLGEELLGRSLMSQDQAGPAVEAFARAVRAENRSAELFLYFATELHATGLNTQAQALLTKLLRERPLLQDGYVELYEIRKTAGDADGARAVLREWLSADPQNVAAARLVAHDLITGRQYTEARRLLRSLFDRHDTDPQVIADLARFETETGRVNELASLFQQKLVIEPWNFTLASALAQIDVHTGNTSAALAVLDRVRLGIGNDPDLLYSLSADYTALGRSDRCEQVLQEVLKLDPGHPGANNDLGYYWAERGKNLKQAEKMIGAALQTDPDNPTFLDSMAWVLYKLGKFDQATRLLVKATTPASRPDPAVLDHLGDALYRLGRPQQAGERWREAIRRLTGTNDQFAPLRLQLLKKQQQLDAGLPVGVAPVGEESK